MLYSIKKRQNISLFAMNILSSLVSISFVFKELHYRKFKTVFGDLHQRASVTKSV